MNEIEKLEKKIGYVYKNKNYAKTAITHSSFANEVRGECNERMEFLGDAVLSIITSEYLFKNFKNKAEGDLSKLRASLVCEKALCTYAGQIGLGECLLLGKGEQHSGGRERPSILADAFEAVIASIYLDSGIKQAEKFVMPFIIKEIERPAVTHFKDYKTMLQEIVQQNSGERLEYVLVEEKGPDHDKHFVYEVHLNTNVIGKGGGRSKREAEQQAAHEALKLLGY
ncbi:MAG: ribonuclease III [Clostridia bacterium]|nr:ribonuclease III [Clostridia bacterium]